MFKPIKGAHIPDIFGLKEEYQIKNNVLYANVSADNILKIFEAFLQEMKDGEPLFLFIEAPCREADELKLNGLQPGEKNKIGKFHSDIYYLDGLYRENTLKFLHSDAGELLINDGLVSFGFGSLESKAELGKYKYNVLEGFCDDQNVTRLTSVFDALGIPCVPEITTAWDLFSDENPGSGKIYEYNGKNTYDLIDGLKQAGLYKAEIREDDSGDTVWKA